MAQCGLVYLDDFTLVSGVGDYSEHRACVMSAAVACYRLSRGEPMGDATDEMDCCCPVIRSFLIRLNDSSLWRDDAHRTEVLMPFVGRLAGTRNESLTQQRLYMLADWAIRTIAADAMDRAKFAWHAEHAAKLRAVDPIVDKPTAKAGRAAAASAAASAAAYAGTYAYAAAYAGTYASAYASADAYAYAYAYASASASAAAVRKTIINQCAEVLERMIALSE